MTRCPRISPRTITRMKVPPAMPADHALLFLQRVHQLGTEQADDLFMAVNILMAADAAPSAPASRDHARLLTSVRSRDRQDLWGQVAMSWLHLTMNVADHARALGLLLARTDAGVPIYAGTSLARVAVESAAQLTYLMDRRVGFEQRFGRGVAFLIADADLASKAAAKVPGNAMMAQPGTAIAARQRQLHDVIDRARIEIVPGKNGAVKGVRVSAAAPEAFVSVKSTLLVEDEFVDLPAIYDLFSGVVHGKPWQLGDRARAHGRYATWAADPLDVATAVLAVSAAAHRTAAVHAWYRGFDNDDTVARMLARVATVDKAMSTFATERLGSERLRPSIARFLQPGAHQA